MANGRRIRSDNQTPISHFMFSPSGIKQTEFCQALVAGALSYPQLGNRLIALAEHAHGFRQYDSVEAYGQLLSNFPLESYQAIGNYFLGLATNRKGKGDQEKAKRLFEQAIRAAPDAYKVKAILSLSALAFHRRDLDSGLYYYQETIKSGGLSATSLRAALGISHIKAIEGDHAQALKDLESILPVIKYAPAHLYFDILNSYAVELGEVGRKDEARNVIGYVLASPFAFAYPEWHETARDLEPPRRSSVTISTSHQNVRALPEREPSKPPAQEPQPARVFDLAAWKKKIACQASTQEAAPRLDEMSMQELVFKLIEVITDYSPDAVQMRAIVAFVINFLSGTEPPAEEPST